MKGAFCDTMRGAFFNDIDEHASRLNGGDMNCLLLGDLNEISGTFKANFRD